MKQNDDLSLIRNEIKLVFFAGLSAKTCSSLSAKHIFVFTHDQQFFMQKKICTLTPFVAVKKQLLTNLIALKDLLRIDIEAMLAKLK